MRLLKTLGSLLFLAFVWSNEGVTWTEGDAVFIEDGSLLKRFKAAQEEALLLQNFSPKDNSNGTGLGINETTATLSSTPAPVQQQQTAIPVEVVPGQCVKFSECFPLLFFPQESRLEPRMTNNRNLYEFILSTSDSCEPSDLPVGRSSMENSDDVYIWCRERKNSPKPSYVVSSTSTLDLKAGEEDEMTSDIGTCGPVKSPSIDGEEVSSTSTPSEEGDGEDGDDKLKARVVGGEEADLGEFPWMVALLSRGKQVCGGSLLDRTHVLIAAHCISHLKPSHLPRLKVLIGDHDIRDPTDIQHQERNVSAVIFHEEFTSVTIHSDVGMLVLSEPVDLADNVAPICLYQGSVPFDDGSTYATMAGWGQTAEDAASSSVLLKTSLRIWTNEECNKRYQGKAPAGITPGMVCAGVTDPEIKDACRGDSGGPLFFVRENKTQQIGIVSWGIGCGKYPGVFTRVPKYLDWIKEKRSLSLKYFKK